MQINRLICCQGKPHQHDEDKVSGLGYYPANAHRSVLGCMQRYRSAELDARVLGIEPTGAEHFGQSMLWAKSRLAGTVGGLEPLVQLSLGVAIAQKRRADSSHHNGPPRLVPELQIQTLS